MGNRANIPERWPGWRTECWDDRYEEQLLRCGGALRLPALDLAAGVDEMRDWLHQRVFQSFADSPVGAIVNIAGMLADAGVPEPMISKSAVTGSPLRPAPEVWNRFAAACKSQRSLYTKSA